MVAAGAVSSMTGRRTAAMRSDDNSDIFLSFARRGMVIREGDSREAIVEPGDIALTSLNRQLLHARLNELLTLQISRQALAPLVSGLDDRLTRSLSIAQPGLHLLRGYAASLFAEPQLSPGLREIAGGTCSSLLALAIGANREAQDAATHGGVRAARLSAAKAEIMAQLTLPGLSAGVVAAELGVSPRYCTCCSRGRATPLPSSSPSND